MELAQATIQLSNAWEVENVRRGLMDEREVKSFHIDMRVDPESIYMCINEAVREQLDLSILYKKKRQMADGGFVECDVVGPIEVRFKNRECTVDAIVLPGNCECLFGAIPMGAMDVLVSPSKKELIVNPENPEYAVTTLKHIQAA